MKGCIDKKQQHGQFLLKTQEIASENLWSWLKQGCLKRRTEAFVMTAQEQAVRKMNLKQRQRRLSRIASAVSVERLMRL